MTVYTKGGLPLEQALEQYVPNSHKKLIQRFDVEDKYGQYLINCRKSFSREKLPGNEFSEEGIQKVKALDEASCAEIIDAIDTGVTGERAFREDLMDKVLPNIDAELVSYFKSEYAPIWVRFYANMPEPGWEDQYSFYWHCDGGPSKHLKLLLYLNSSEESGGNTEYVSYMDTMEYKNLGYVCCDLEKRLPDLEELSDICGLPWEPKRMDIKAGEGLLFEPFNIMHKGVWPTKAPRYIVQICFIASHVNWKTITNDGGLLSNENAWPKIA